MLQHRPSEKVMIDLLGGVQNVSQYHALEAIKMNHVLCGTSTGFWAPQYDRQFGKIWQGECS